MTKGVDLYTKIVLTVIAACLIYIVTKDIKIIPEAVAQSGGSIMDVNIVSIDGKRFGPIDVSVLNPALPIKIIGNLAVKINDVGFGILNPLPVRVQ